MVRESVGGGVEPGETSVAPNGAIENNIGRHRDRLA